MSDRTRKYVSEVHPNHQPPEWALKAAAEENRSAPVTFMPGPETAADVWEAHEARRRREAGNREPWTPPPIREVRVPEYVYFFQRVDGPIKIGTTVQLAQRRASLETGTGPLRLVGLEPGGFRREGELHRQFSEARLYGEWFHPTQELVAYVTTIRDVSMRLLKHTRGILEEVDTGNG